MDMPKFKVVGLTVQAAGWGDRQTNRLMELWEIYIDIKWGF